MPLFVITDDRKHRRFVEAPSMLDAVFIYEEESGESRGDVIECTRVAPEGVLRDDRGATAPEAAHA